MELSYGHVYRNPTGFHRIIRTGGKAPRGCNARRIDVATAARVSRPWSCRARLVGHSAIAASMSTFSRSLLPEGV